MKSHTPKNPPEISQVIRSNRKSISLEIKPDGRLIVRAPKYATQAQILNLVAHKTSWINKTRARAAHTFANRKPKTFKPGETFWYLGELYPLRLTDRSRPPLELDGTFLLARAAQNRSKEVFITWYREETRAITHNLIREYQKKYHFKVNKVRITSARTRWGSCSSKNNLNFTYRLCMAPLRVIDYVVLHELTHLKHHNHSKAFWSAIEKIKPDYRKDRDWLKKQGALLTLD
ncbi:MAG: SprT family zinc-dependent metalloprotease [Chloroflexota bacterium]|nr:SprT family zinc-dependent metalloprotease [Chloroflexota bacterium]